MCVSFKKRNPRSPVSRATFLAQKGAIQITNLLNIPPQTPPSGDPCPRPPTSSSSHLSNCTTDPGPASSFFQVVGDDSQSVHYMETIPLFKSSSFPPGQRKTNSIYHSIYDNILEEKMKVCSALENEVERCRLKRKNRVSSVCAVHRDDCECGYIRRGNSVQNSMDALRRNRNQPTFEERARAGYDYTSTDHYYGPPIYRDPQTSLRNRPSSGYNLDKDYSQNYYARYRSLPISPSPFRPPRHQKPFSVEQYSSTFLHYRDSIPAEPYFTRASSIRQSPYYPCQRPHTSLSPYHHPDLCNDFRGNPSRYIMGDIPMTRMTRLKQPGRTYWRDDGMKTNVGIGLGKVLGMTASRSLRRGAKRDISVGTHKTPSRSTQKHSKVLSLKCILI